ncbi:citramalate synthase [Oceanispirochaeta crateris]|uniref:Citramalate synthase n=1 Tax=Oceanispirochaeta crateris TaxID=2518645 RepID=A0A5C1QLD5_9SPIO|nr:citramalate synthase [Oceanispirochaeta crateris]QEN07770.1 citramalate synthase [Oceanispirochaeta crateris]
MGKSEIAVFDTTLRDGTQGTGINFTLKDKLEIAEKLDDFGIDYIEGGFPLASEKETAFFKEIQKLNLKHSKICAFGSTRKPGIHASQDAHINALLQAETPTVVVVGKSWDAHASEVLQTSLDENLNMIHDSITYLKSEGREIIFDLEHFFDGYLNNQAYALKVLQTASDAGADCLVLCDTNGGTLPQAVIVAINNLKTRNLAPLGVHFHNDTATAVASSILAVEAGAVHVQGTINGWGERVGNANLCAIIPNLILKMKKEVYCSTKLKDLTKLSRFTAEKANIIPEKNQAYVGETAFTHKAGQHADVLAKAEHLMEHMDSSLIGNSRKILLSELAGKSTIVRKLSKYGDFDKKSEIVSKLTETLKKKEMDGYEYEAAEASFDVIMRKALGKYTPLFELQNYHIESYKTMQSKSKTVGRLFLNVSGVEHMGAAVGEGPVDTLNASVRDALIPSFPFLKNIHLSDYRVRVLNPEEATAAKVRVFITFTDNNKTWDSVGVSENIIEASWEALLDAINFYYNNFILEE